jgi:Zn finger protein HypA/HybF involved in hydrogenase expression
MILNKLQWLVCKRCNHVWLPRKKEVRVCPACGSAWWDKDKEEEEKAS